MAAYRGYGRSQSAASTTSITSLDGIPASCIRISERCQPPPRVDLPFDYQPGNPSEVLFMEYDFSLEEKIIQWSENQRQTMKALDRAETERVSEAVEKFIQETTNENSTNTDTTEQPEEQDSVKDTDETEPRLFHTRGSEGAANRKQAFQARPFANVGSGILMPTPIAVAADMNQPGTFDENKENQGASFDLKDFESEQDPFENMELKILNDREELNKMLLSSQAASVDKSDGDTDSNKGPEQPDGKNYLNLLSQIGDDNVQVDVNNEQPPAQCNLKDVDYPDIESIDSSQFSMEDSNATDSVAGTNPSNSVGVAPASNQAYFPPRALPSLTNGNGADLSQLPAVTESQGNIYDNARLPPILSQGYAAQQSSLNYESHNVNNHSSISSVPQITTEGVYGKSQNIYSRHSVHYTPTNGIVTIVNKDGSSGSSTPTSTPLRSAQSTPDISGSEDRRLPPVLPSSHTPPPYVTPRSRSRSPPPRPSTQQDNSESWNRYGILPPTPSPRKDDSGGRDSPSVSSPALPDPYQGMSSEDQRFVNTITDMGFPRARVARAVRKFGQDDKKVVDYLFLVNRLSERGPHDGITAEKALHTFEDNEEKAMLYLQLLNQFKELGFREDNIKDALVTCDLDDNKALDLLTSS